MTLETPTGRAPSFPEEKGPSSSRQRESGRLTLAVAGELWMQAGAYVGLRRRERPDAARLMVAIADSADDRGPRIPEHWVPRLPGDIPCREVLGPNTLRVALPGGEAVLKRLGPEGRGRFGWPRVRSAARRFHDLAHRVRAAGVSTPRVLGFWERVLRPRQAFSWVLTEYVRAPSIWVLRDAGVFGDPSARRRCTLAVAACVARLHRAGLFSDDLHPSNLLMADDEVWVVSLGAMQEARWVRPRARDLESLGRSFAAVEVGPMERARFLAAYVGRVPEARAVRAGWVEAVVKEATRRQRRELQAQRDPSEDLS